MAHFRYGLHIRFYGSEKFFGHGMARLLTLVQEQHSLRKAAAQMRMAYSKAWRMVQTAEAELGASLLVTQTGGKDGGGATLTPFAQDFLQRYQAFEKAVDAEAHRLFETMF